MTECDRGEARKERSVLRLVPVRSKLIWGANDDRVALESERFCGLEPSPKRLFRELAAGAVEDTRPDFSRRERHSDVDNLGKAGVRSYPSRVEKANRRASQNCVFT